MKAKEKLIGQDWAGKAAAGFVVSWQSRAIDPATGRHPQRHLFYPADQRAKAEKTRATKEALRLKDVTLEERAVELKFSSLIPAN